MTSSSQTMLRNSQAGDEFEALARRLEQQGNQLAADAAYQSAADIDLADDDLQGSWGGAFNGQAVRQRMFEEVSEALAFDAIVETGTYRGTTTEWIAQRFAKPILTCEINKRYYLQAKKKLTRFTQVQVALADSTDFLQSLKDEFPRDARILFYLDAHWLDRLPLHDELALIRDCFPRSVAMIDDFDVPFDRGYLCDNYGPGKRVDLNLVAPFREGAAVFFPSVSSKDETGAKRGVCVLTWDADAASILGGVPTLRIADERDWAGARLTLDLETATSSAGFMAGIAANVMSEFKQASDQISAEIRQAAGHVQSELDRGREDTAAAVEQRVKTMAVGVAGAVADAIRSPMTIGEDPQKDVVRDPFLTEIRKAIGSIPPALIAGGVDDNSRAALATEIGVVVESVVSEAFAPHAERAANAFEDRLKNVLIGVAGAVVNALLRPSAETEPERESSAWGPFLNEIRRAVAPVRSVLIEGGDDFRESPAPNVEIFEVLSQHTDRAVEIFEDRLKNVFVGVAGAAANALLSEAPPGTNQREDERWGPFLTDVRKALAPLRDFGMQPLLERLDRATATEIGLRADLVRMEYRAVAAEKEARQAEERFADRDERRSHKEQLLRQVIDDLEPELEGLRAENARLSELLDEVRTEGVGVSEENEQLQEAVRDMLDQQGKLNTALSNIAASRWIKVGTRLGLSKLGRHLNENGS